MKITLQRKFDPTDRDPLLVQYLETVDGDSFKRTLAVKVGETLDIDDDLAIEIMQKYKGLFSMGEGVKLSAKSDGYAHKGKPGMQARVPTAAEG